MSTRNIVTLDLTPGLKLKPSARHLKLNLDFTPNTCASQLLLEESDCGRYIQIDFYFITLTRVSLIGLNNHFNPLLLLSSLHSPHQLPPFLHTTGRACQLHKLLSPQTHAS
jgi:hypothetical protein